MKVSIASLFGRSKAEPAPSRHAKPAAAPQPPHAAPASPTEPYAGLMFPPSAVADLWQYVEVLRSGARDDEDEANFRLGRAARKRSEADTLASLLRRAEREAAEPLGDGLEVGLHDLLPPVALLRHYSPPSNSFRPESVAVASAVHTVAADVDCPACGPLIPPWAREVADPTADALTMHAVPAGVAR